MMKKPSRRDLFAGAGTAMLAGAAAGQTTRVTKPVKRIPLELKDYQPKSMLHVKETKVPRAKFPVIDIHTHLSWAGKGPKGEGIEFLTTPEDALKVMDRKNLRILTNLTGGQGLGLREAVQKFDKKYPGRFITFTEPWWSRASEPGYPKFQADELQRAHNDGARGLKVLKTLGLFLRENGKTGPLVKVDDKRFDPMWEACAALKMPVAIHISDPEAFFLPTDKYNERFEELNNHPDWSFYDHDFPSNKELLEARNRVYARHPKTQFISLHVGHDAENLAYVSECMDKFPNMSVELGARIGELGRQPRTSRKFFDRYQDRILFGTDAVPNGYETPQQIYNDQLYEIYFRFLETDDEYFDYAPAPVPPQGRWRIYGVALPDQILRKVYNENAARLVGIKL
jgi:predicted TIM-barrel fold metal-dependent hydrolase